MIYNLLTSIKISYKGNYPRIIVFIKIKFYYRFYCFLKILLQSKMRKETKLVLVYISKALRNFHNGAFSFAFLYFTFATINYGDPIFLPILIAKAILSGIIKSKLLTQIQKIGKCFTLLITFALYVLPLVAFLDFNVKYLYFFGQIITIVCIGFFPLDGQEIIIFEEIERNQICFQGQLQEKSHILRKYSIIGNIFQAIGSVMSILYITYGLQKVQYIEYIRVRQYLVFLYFIGLVNIGFYSLFFIWKQQSTKTQMTTKSIQIILKDCSMIKYFSIANGFSFGLLSAPFLIYFVDLKYSLYFDKMSIILGCFFLLKGLGQEFMSKYTQLERIFKYWNILGNFSLASIAFIDNQIISLFLLVLSFPIWNYSRVKLKQLIGLEQPQTNFWQRLKYWERFGAVCGILVCSFSFRILYSHAYFGYPFLLGGIIKLLVSKQIGSFNQNKKEQKMIIQNIKNINQQQQKINISQNQTIDNPTPNKLHNFRRTGCKSISIVLIIMCFILIYISRETLQIFNPSIQQNLAIASLTVQRAKSDKFDYPYIKLLNQSLAHYLIRQNIKNIRLANCDSLCLSQYSGREEYYDQLSYDKDEVQWHHYASMKYFRTKQQAQHQLSPILNLPKQIKGLSLMWQNPVRYNKIPDEIHSFIISFCGMHGFHFDQMPSLNLRGMENKILFIFTRTKRNADKLHLPFVKKPPTHNYLAIQTQLKLVSSYNFMRQYILYHLRIGVDKFFFYNNDRDQNQANFYFQNNAIGQLASKCFNKSMGHEMIVFSQIWQQFYDHIIYIPWRISAVRRKPQRESYVHYSIYYQKITKFTARTDFDQYIFTPSDKYLPDYLEELLVNHHLTNIKMKAKGFMTFLCHKKQLVIQQSMSYYPSNNSSTKSIGMTKLLIDSLIHGFSIKNGGYAELDDSRHEIMHFHYKPNSKSGNLSDWTADYSMKKYVQQMKESCKGKCSDSTLKPNCQPEFYDKMISQYCTISQ